MYLKITSHLDEDSIKTLVKKLAVGTFDHEEACEDGGHGAWVVKPIDE